ncbi:MAG: hypothetical protein WBF90_02300 [Rivularia sp. (in: cyanobacteria)]
MSKARKHQRTSLLKYHPIRYAQSRELFLPEATEKFLSVFKDPIQGVFDKYQITFKKLGSILAKYFHHYLRNSVSSNLYSVYMRELYQEKIDRDSIYKEKQQILAKDAILCHVNEEIIILKQYASFIHSGNNIFEFSPHLLNLFWDTDVDNVLTKDIKLPFPTVYLHFGKQKGKRIYSTLCSIQNLVMESNLANIGNYINFDLDGAYVSQCPQTGALDIVLTSVANQRQKYNNWIDGYEDMVGFTLKIANTETTVNDGLIEAKNILCNKNNNYVQNLVDSKINDLKSIINHHNQNQNIIKTGFDRVAEYLKLVINCLLYLQSYPEKIVEDYPIEAPKNLVDQTKRKSVSVVAEKKLNQLGYTKIKFCGRSQQHFEQVENESELESTLEVAATRSPHKRRSHLRKQRYGPGRKQWKFVWIKETTVHREHYQPSTNSYRIYEVEPVDCESLYSN